MMKNITSGFQVSETYNQLPPYFIKNEGQFDEEKIVYYSKSAGYSAYFTEEGARFVFVGREKGEALADKEPPEELIAFRVDFKFLNGDKAIDPVAMGELPGKVNYFRGLTRLSGGRISRSLLKWFIYKSGRGSTFSFMEEKES
ncbi:hypothetical protein ACQUWN_21295 [Rossellomorea aquimaris]|uniref:DUF7948 domain-containing protein n=1 Tax=Rossellomorea aquimaris TaxID=189382 RepID=UPI003D182721